MVEPYGIGDTAETFKYSLFLVLCNRLSSCAIAILSLIVSPCMDCVSVASSPMLSK